MSAVASLSEAIALTGRRLFDVAVIDVPPTGPSPTEVIDQLRAHGQLPRRVVVCSCAPLDEYVPQPFTAVLPKPYPFEHLLMAVFGAWTQRRPARSGVFAKIRTGGMNGSARTKRPSIAPGGLAPLPLPITKEAREEGAEEEGAKAAELSGIARALRVRGRVREAGAARAIAPESQRSSALAFKGTRRAARVRRGRE